MKRNLIIAFSLFTVFVCAIFFMNNPVFLMHLDEKFSEGDVFMPHDGHFDFGMFSLNSSNARNYTAKHVLSGHAVLVDDTGKRTINVIEWGKMTRFKMNSKKAFLEGELLKPSRMVNGICVHEIEFSGVEKRYSACANDTDGDTWIYIAAPDEHDVAEMVKSLRFAQYN